MLRKIKIEAETVEKLREFQVRERSDCHAAFTTPCNGEIWPFANFGNINVEAKSINLYGLYPELDEIARLVLERYPSGGARFFISKSRNRVFTKKNESAEEDNLALLDY